MFNYSKRLTLKYWDKFKLWKLNLPTDEHSLKISRHQTFGCKNTNRIVRILYFLAHNQLFKQWIFDNFM